MSLAHPATPAPAFTLPGMFGNFQRRDYKLAEYAGAGGGAEVFYPGDNTPVCTRQLNAYTRQIEQFTELDAQVLAISPQSVDSHDQFSCKQGGFAFPLLADEQKEVGGAYGILGPLGFYRRSAFVIDGSGQVAYVHRSLAGATFRPTSRNWSEPSAALPS